MSRFFQVLFAILYNFFQVFVNFLPGGLDMGEMRSEGDPNQLLRFRNSFVMRDPKSSKFFPAATATAKSATADSTFGFFETGGVGGTGSPPPSHNGRDRRGGPGVAKPVRKLSITSNGVS